jgi:hypothetical protein
MILLNQTVFCVNIELFSDCMTKPETRKVASDNSKEIISKDHLNTRPKLRKEENLCFNNQNTLNSKVGQSNKTLVQNKENSKSNNIFKKVKQLQVTNNKPVM